MTVSAARARLASSPVTEDAVGIAFGVLVGAVVVGRAFRLEDVPAVSTFVLVAVSICIEALPFILVGALVSALLAVAVPERAFARAARLPLAMQLPCAALGAFAFPVCDCGTVPVARRLLARGMHPAASLTFMLAAPIVNPLVLASTFVAYGGGAHGLRVAAARTALALVTAIAVGLALARTTALRPVPPDEHAHAPASFGAHVAHDFLGMGRFLVVGAALAALLQSLVPQSLVGSVAGTPVVAALALMAIAFALSLCSEADAFVAASLGAFGLGPQLAFLVLGPVGDAKLTVLYGATFQRWFALRLLAVAVPVILVGSLVAGRIVG
jgi:hypothetical protein